MYANTHKQSLVGHSVLVGLLASAMLARTYASSGSLSHEALIAGLLHDIGKLDPSFQAFLTAGECSVVDEEDGIHILESKKTKGFSFNTYPRHNEVSWALLTRYLNEFQVCADLGLSSAGWERVKYGVYWHHAKPLREGKDINGEFTANDAILGKLDHWTTLTSTLQDFLNQALSVLKRSPLTVLSEPSSRVDAVPEFKNSYLSIKGENWVAKVGDEAYRSMLRASVVSADRLVSKLSAAEVDGYIELYQTTGQLGIDVEAIVNGTKLKDDCTLTAIEQMTSLFEERHPGSPRNEIQAKAAASLARRSFSILKGPAGCGKTKIMLEYLAALKNNRKTYVFVPRVAIGTGLFDELVKEYSITHSVEIFCGESRQQALGGKVVDTVPGQELSCDIVITTVDQIAAITLSHSRIDLLNDAMLSNVIVDEFHELFDIPGLTLMFLELIALRCKSSTGKTLLVSATPNPYFLELMSRLETGDGAPLTECVTEVDTFNTKPFELELKAQPPGSSQDVQLFERLAQPGDIVVANTATKAQKAAFRALDKTKDVICFHSKFTPRHKRQVLGQVMKYFGKGGGSTEKLLFAGPIVQASLNITTRVLHTEICHAENWFQRLGRLNRFGTFDSGLGITYAVQGTKKPFEIDAAQLGKLHQRHRTQAWLTYLHTQILGESTQGAATLSQLYDHYVQFHESAEAHEAYEADFFKILDKSRQLFTLRTFDPIQFPKPKAVKVTKKAQTLSSNSLRGTSLYVLPSLLSITESGTTEDWLWGPGSDVQDLLTDSVAYLQQDDYPSILDYLVKDHSIDAVRFKSKLPENLTKNIKTRARRVSASKYLPMCAKTPEMPLVLRFLGKTSKNSLSECERVYILKHGVPLGLMSA